jgi:hypothetical protein
LTSAEDHAAAAGLLTHDPRIAQQALELLSSNASLIDSFGRQATVTKLLSITLDLKLNPSEQSRFLKQVLRANALRKF